MKHQSNKRARLMRRVTPERRKFLELFPFCWACFDRYQMTVHEIARGGSREAALAERLTWFAACARCNCGELGDATIWPVTRQLATKKLFDPDYFDLKRFNVLRRESPTAIVSQDLTNHLRRERKRLNGWI